MNDITSIFHEQLLLLTEPPKNEKEFMFKLQQAIVNLIDSCPSHMVVSLYRIDISNCDFPKAVPSFVLSKSGKVALSIKNEGKFLTKNFTEKMCIMEYIEGLDGISEKDRDAFVIDPDSEIKIFPIKAKTGCWGFFTFEAEMKCEMEAQFTYVIRTIINIIRNYVNFENTRTALKKSEMKYKEIAQMLPEIIFETDTHGNFQFLNMDGYKAFGLAFDETNISDHKLTDFISKRDETVIDKIIEMCVSGRVPSIVQDVMAVSKDGVEFPVILRINAVKNGKVTGTRGIMINIAERKHAEAKLKLEHDKLLSMFNNIDEAIYVAEIETNELLFANDYLKNVCGEDIIGKKCHDALNRKDAPCDNCYDNNIADGKTVITEFYSEISKQYFMITSKLIDWVDGRKARFKIALDITDLKAAEECINAEKKKIEGLMTMIPEAVVACDEEGMITYANEPFVRMVKRGIYKECVGSRLSDMFYSISDYDTLYEALSRHKVIKNAELKMKDAFGNVLLTNISCSMNGETIYLINDITEKRGVEAFNVLNNNIDKLIQSTSMLAESLKNKEGNGQ